MAKNVLIPLAPGFEEIETITVVDILRRAGAQVTLAGTQAGPIEGSRGVRILPDELLEALSAENFDLIVLPGGQPGTTNLQNSSTVLDLLQNMHSQDKYIAAICAAPLVLQTAGVLQKARITSHPSVKEQLGEVPYQDERVVEDHKIITSRGPGTAMEFAFKLVEILFGKERVEKVNAGVMARI